MATEELSESDVLWPDTPHRPADAPSTSMPRKPPARRPASSRPVDIPKAGRSRHRWDDEDDEEEELVPPHVLVSRRRTPEEGMAFSVLSGPGRARDRNHLRNSVLRMTGFIEG